MTKERRLEIDSIRSKTTLNSKKCNELMVEGELENGCTTFILPDEHQTEYNRLQKENLLFDKKLRTLLAEEKKEKNEKDGMGVF